MGEISMRGVGWGTRPPSMISPKGDICNVRGSSWLFLVCVCVSVPKLTVTWNVKSDRLSFHDLFSTLPRFFVWDQALRISSRQIRDNREVTSLSKTGQTIQTLIWPIQNAGRSAWSSVSGWHISLFEVNQNCAKFILVIVQVHTFYFLLSCTVEWNQVPLR